jgi:hypothetical protein
VGKKSHSFSYSLAQANRHFLDTAHSTANARRLRNEADKLEVLCLLVHAASTAVARDAFSEVSGTAGKALRAKFGGGSITSVFAWLARPVGAGREWQCAVLA